MDREAMDALRHDRRLAHRRGWITQQAAKAAEETLPDASAKAITLGEAIDAAEGEAEAAPPSPPTFPQP